MMHSIGAVLLKRSTNPSVYLPVSHDRLVIPGLRAILVLGCRPLALCWCVGLLDNLRSVKSTAIPQQARQDVFRETLSCLDFCLFPCSPRKFADAMDHSWTPLWLFVIFDVIVMTERAIITLQNSRLVVIQVAPGVVHRIDERTRRHPILLTYLSRNGILWRYGQASTPWVKIWLRS